MAVFNKFQSYVEALSEKIHNLGSDQLKIALTAAANAPVNTNTQLSNLTEITYTFASTRNVVTTSSIQTAGTYKLILTDLIITASGGSVGPFRYVILYNDTPVNKELIGWYDNGSEVTLADGETFTVDFDGSAGAITLV